jgi:hypothetical protein
VAVAEGVLVQTDSVVAGFEVLAASLKDFGSGSALNEIAALVEQPAAPFDTVAGGIAQAGQTLETALGVADVLPAPGDVRATRTRLQQLQATVTGLKAQPAAPAAAPSTADAAALPTQRRNP